MGAGARVHPRPRQPEARIPSRDGALLVIQTANVVGTHRARSPRLNITYSVVSVFIFNWGGYKNSKRD